MGLTNYRDLRGLKMRLGAYAKVVGEYRAFGGVFQISPPLTRANDPCQHDIAFSKHHGTR